MTDDAAWDDPDRAVQIEDDDPESLVGDDVEFDAAADDGPEDFPRDAGELNAGDGNPPVGGA